ncbi:LLM class F420-dependent oxidoreductase [Streptomyces sp. NPDC047315]|uniref:LLM class F420-dependent oxidoreductase n=1 Tax=Streptomyces sp. NPDC047315 TaxID=3155142 RepID=UPI003400F778
MRISTTITVTDETITPVRLARELEERGFAGLYLPEHTHIPVERTTPFPFTDGGDLPSGYGRTLDPFVGLAQAAAVTSRISLGTGVLLVAQHDPITVAKQAASLDHLSGGRFTLGVGFGWNKEEAVDHGVEWATRRELVLDQMRVMRALWADEPTAYEGEFRSVSASHAFPKPVRGASPRTLVGGAAGPKLFAHIAAYADGWMPIGAAGVRDALPELRAVWEAAGRSPKELEIMPYAVQPTPEKMAYYEELGVEEVVFLLPTADEDGVLRALDDFGRYLP